MAKQTRNQMLAEIESLKTRLAALEAKPARKTSAGPTIKNQTIAFLREKPQTIESLRDALAPMFPESNRDTLLVTTARRVKAGSGKTYLGIEVKCDEIGQYFIPSTDEKKSKKSKKTATPTESTAPVESTVELQQQ